MPGAIPPNPSIYHITHVANLRSIVEQGCLWSDAQRIARGLQTTNIGYSHIKQLRLNRPVTVGLGGMLGDYVPFNFCPRSVMLFVVARGHRDYPGGDDDIVHLMSSVNTAIAIRKPWAFTDLHADLGYAMYFNSVDSLSEVDWTVMPPLGGVGQATTTSRRGGKQSSSCATAFPGRPLRVSASRTPLLRQEYVRYSAAAGQPFSFGEAGTIEAQ